MFDNVVYVIVHSQVFFFWGHLVHIDSSKVIIWIKLISANYLLLLFDMIVYSWLAVIVDGAIISYAWYLNLIVKFRGHSQIAFNCIAIIRDRVFCYFTFFISDYSLIQNTSSKLFLRYRICLSKIRAKDIVILVGRINHLLVNPYISDISIGLNNFIIVNIFTDSYLYVFFKRHNYVWIFTIFAHTWLFIWSNCS